MSWNIRRDYIETVESTKNAEISEDQKHNDETSIQDITNKLLEKLMIFCP